MVKKQDTFTYDFKEGNSILHSGITKDLEKREKNTRVDGQKDA